MKHPSFFTPNAAAARVALHVAAPIAAVAAAVAVHGTLDVWAVGAALLMLIAYAAAGALCGRVARRWRRSVTGSMTSMTLRFGRSLVFAVVVAIAACHGAVATVPFLVTFLTGWMVIHAAEIVTLAMNVPETPSTYHPTS